MPRTRPDTEPSPVFVDASGRRGRRLRGLGWVVGVLCVGLAAAMIGGLIGTESQAPAFRVPAGVDTTPPSEYLDAPPPVGPRSPSTAATETPPAGTAGTPSAAGIAGAAGTPGASPTGTLPGTSGTDASPTGTTSGTGDATSNTTAP